VGVVFVICMVDDGWCFVWWDWFICMIYRLWIRIGEECDWLVLDYEMVDRVCLIFM